jgi:hypothetical protein
MTYHLTQWEAVEIFCKIISKYEDIPLDDFQENNLLIATLTKYEKLSLSTEFSKRCFEPMAKKEGSTVYYPKALYDLTHNIRYSEPFTPSASLLILLLKYIGESNTLTTFNLLKEWVPNDKQRTFENTVWHLYYYEEYTEFANGHCVSGVSRAIVRLLPFGKLQIDNIDVSHGEPGNDEQYRGKFSIYGGKKGNYLLLEARMGSAAEKDLHVLVYIGVGELKQGDIALGEYHNVNDSIYSGTAIIEKMGGSASLESQFFRYGDTQIDALFWQYFTDKRQNRIRVKSGINNKKALQKWMKSKQDVTKKAAS